MKTPPSKHLGDWSDHLKLCARLLREGAAAPAASSFTATIGAWSVAYTKLTQGHLFSARLMRPGRSHQRDWFLLGALAKGMGAPQQMPSTVETDPDSTHYFVWDTQLSDDEQSSLIEAGRTLGQQAAKGKDVC